MHQGPVRCIRFSADGRILACGGDDKNAFAMDVASGTGRQFVGHEGRVTTIDVSDRGIVATGSGDHTIRVWNMSDGKCVHRLPCARGVSHVSFTPRGHMLAAAGANGAIVFDANDWKSIPVVKRRSVKLARFSRDGNLLATVTADDSISVWDTSRALDSVRLTEVGNRSEGAIINDVAFDFSGERLGICRNDGVLTIWNRVTSQIMQPQLREDAPVGKIWAMDFSADGGFLPVFTGLSV